MEDLKKEKVKSKFKIKKLLLVLAIAIFIVAMTIIIIIGLNKKYKNVNMCIMEYNVNGGTQINSLDMECGSKVSEPITPTKDGFEFVGWYIGDKKVNFDELYLNENMVINAKWQTKENIQIVVVKFDTQGGSKIDDIEIAKGSKISPPLTPKKDGYIFKYWSYNNQRFDFINDINESITLVAVFEKNDKVNSNSNNLNNNSNNNNSNNNNSNNNNATPLEICTYEMRELDSDIEIPVGLDEEMQFSPYYGLWSYNLNGCDITYKVDNSAIAEVSKTGVVKGKKLGSNHANVCVVDKTSKKELYCFKVKFDVQYQVGSERAKKDSENLVKAIDGYYWYLDGYEYAYLKVDNIDWYDHKCLDWKSKYIDIQNNKFVMTEDTGEFYLDSTDIHNRFLVNPTEYAYSLIVDYNMHVVSNKLYITLGSKTYSFTKATSEKIVKPKLSVSSSNLTVLKNSQININVKISPSYATYNLSVSSSNPDVVSNCSIFDTNINCYAKEKGTSTLTIMDSEGASVNVNVTVNVVNVSGVSLNKKTLNLKRGDSDILEAIVSPNDAYNKNITWSSSNSNVAKVENGKVTAVGSGTATIYVKTIDGGYTDSCVVNVTNPPLSAQGSIGYIEMFTSSGLRVGISVSIYAKGGTGTYSYYNIKLYKSDGTLISESSNSTSNELIVSGYKSGSYYAEFEVRDSASETYKGKTGIYTISI